MYVIMWLRCFLQDLTETRLELGLSKNPGCAGLSTPDTSPLLMKLTPGMEVIALEFCRIEISEQKC